VWRVSFLSGQQTTKENGSLARSGILRLHLQKLAPEFFFQLISSAIRAII